MVTYYHTYTKNCFNTRSLTPRNIIYSKKQQIIMWSRYRFAADLRVAYKVLLKSATPQISFILRFSLHNKISLKRFPSCKEKVGNK